MPQHVFRCSGLCIAGVALAGLSLAALGQIQPAKPPAPLPMTVEHCMETIDDEMDVLAKQIGKPEALATIWDIERLAQQAKTLTPEHLKGGATAENMAGFRKAQIELMKLFLQVEGDIIDNKSED